MKKFRFELDPVLRQRERAEQAHQRVVAELERERVALESRVRGWGQEIQTMRDDLREQLRTGGALTGVRLQANASVHAMAESRRVAIQLAGLLQRLEVARGKLAEAAAARRAVELLRERRLAEWHRQARLEEQRELDELASRKEVVR